MTSLKIKFWGVRGSIATPGPETLRYGGNTPCVEVRTNQETLFILDAGTGIRRLGMELVKQKAPLNIFILISHFHWDHIQGLPFFRPAHQEKNKICIIGSDDTSLQLNQIIAFQMDPTYFPIAIQDMKAKITFRSVKDEKFRIGDVEIETVYLNHPGYALGYRLTRNGKSVVYISDNEPFAYHAVPPFMHQQRQSKNLADIFDNFLEDKDSFLVNFCRNADVLIHDTQYYPEEYQERVTWGHSPFNFTVNLAIRSRVKHLVLFHHDPDHDDQKVDEILLKSRELLAAQRSEIVCSAAFEGMEIEL
ncbi:MAG: MBL fold metallo-hydrolase [Calditrichia bacterium]